MPFLVEVVERGESVTLAYPDAATVDIAGGALLLLDGSAEPMAGYAKWLTFKRVTADELAAYVEVGL